MPLWLTSPMSAPSSLAVEMSEHSGITLAGFCRDDRAAFYSRLDRVSGEKD
jgi:formate dehydrogenase assembly factor FdhD